MPGKQRPKGAAIRRKEIMDRMPPMREPERLPGDRAALPENTLSKPFFGPQGDENRNPPANAPVPPNPTVRVPARAAPQPDARPGVRHGRRGNPHSD